MLFAYSHYDGDVSALWGLGIDKEDPYVDFMACHCTELALTRARRTLGRRFPEARAIDSIDEADIPSLPTVPRI